MSPGNMPSASGCVTRGHFVPRGETGPGASIEGSGVTFIWAGAMLQSDGAQGGVQLGGAEVVTDNLGFIDVVVVRIPRHQGQP